MSSNSLIGVSSLDLESGWCNFFGLIVQLSCCPCCLLFCGTIKRKVVLLLHNILHQCTGYLMCYRGPGFSRSRMIWLLVHPPPPRSRVRELCRRHTGRRGKIDKLLTGDGGRGWARSQSILPQENLVFYKLFNTL
jgi:hypothetical protein